MNEKIIFFHSLHLHNDFWHIDSEASIFIRSYKEILDHLNHRVWLHFIPTTLCQEKNHLSKALY